MVISCPKCRTRYDDSARTCAKCGYMRLGETFRKLGIYLGFAIAMSLTFFVLIRWLGTAIG